MNYSEDAKKLYHIQVGRGDVGRYVILPGDPKRCVKIAQYFDEPQLMADSREYVTYTGTLDGVKVSVTSTGIGGPSASIALEELVQAGADTFVRIGTCGGMQPEVCSGDIVIASGAVRMEGASREYAPIEYPAVPDIGVVNALVAAAGELGLKSHVESAALFIVGGALRVRVGSCFLVMANQEREKAGLPNPVVHDTDMAVRVAVQSVRNLIREDRAQGR